MTSPVGEEPGRTDTPAFGIGLAAGVAAPSVRGPESAMRPSGGSVQLGDATVVVVDQPTIADAGGSGALPLGAVPAARRAEPFVAARARIALDMHRPASLRPCPAGQGLAHALSGWLCTRASRILSGSSTGSVALTRSVNAFIARRVDVVQVLLISPS